MPGSIAISEVWRSTSGGFWRWKVQRRRPVSASNAATRLSLVRTNTSPTATLGTVTTSAPVGVLHLCLPSRSKAISEPSRPATTAVSPSLPTPPISGWPALTRHCGRPLAASTRTTVPSRAEAHRLSPTATGWKPTPAPGSDSDQATRALAGAVTGGSSGGLGRDFDHGQRLQPALAASTIEAASRPARRGNEGMARIMRPPCPVLRA